MTAIPLDFVTFIRASVPPALVILAHFASVSLAVQSAWYSTNWGNYCLQGIKQELHGHDLQHWLDWPKAHAEMNMVSIVEHNAKEPTDQSFLRLF